MGKGRLWVGAGLATALLLSVNGTRAQDPLLSPGDLTKPSGTTLIQHETLPRPNGQPNGQTSEHKGNGHAEVGHYEDEEEGPSGGLYVIADYLLVRPRRRSFDYAIQDPRNDSTVGGNVLALDYDTQSNFRLAAGYRLCDGWEVGAVYTYIHSKDNQTAFPPAGGALFATLSAPLGLGNVDGAVASGSLDMDLVDVELAKGWNVCETLWLRLHGGARFASIQQEHNVFYDFTSTGLGGSVYSNPINFDGAGVRVGGEGHWRMGESGFSLFAKAAGSLLAGDFRNRVTQTINGGASTIVDVFDKYYTVIPVTELGLGVAWSTEHCRISLGYELANFFNMVDSVSFVEGASFGTIAHRTSDLSLEMLALSVGFFY
jgi:hypothetical protein